MNKKEAIAYAQVTLDSMLHSSYSNNITIETLAIEMKQCINLYPRNLIQDIANAKIYALHKKSEYISLEP